MNIAPQPVHQGGEVTLGDLVAQIRMGLLGAAIASLLGYGLLFIITAIASERVYPVGYPIAFFVKWALIVGSLTAILLMTLHGSLWLRIVIKLVMVLGLAVIIIVIYRNEIRLLINRTKMQIPVEKTQTAF